MKQRAVDDYGSKQARALDDYRSEQARAVEDYGSEQARAVDDYGSEQAREVDDYGSEQSSAVEDYSMMLVLLNAVLQEQVPVKLVHLMHNNPLNKNLHPTKPANSSHNPPRMHK